VLWLALASGDASLTDLADAVIAAAAHGAGRNAVGFARAYQQFASGDALAAATSLRAVGDRDHASWWIRAFAADGAVAAAIAYRRAGRPALARAEQAAAVVLYDAVATAMPPIMLARRRRVVAALPP
jgi:hypothetical protein